MSSSRLLLIPIILCACAREDPAAKLPPATGEGAKPRPALPALPKDEASKDGTFSPTEGRTTGTTYPKQEAQLGPSVGGIIASVDVEEGTRVKKGQVLFRQDTRDGELRVQQAKAALAGAEVSLRAMTTEYDRSKALFDEKALNRAQWEQMQAKLDGAKVGVEQAKVALQMAEKSVADATVRAPFDGVVTAKLKSVGEMATMMPPTVVLILQQQSVLELRFRLPERALSQVKTGDTITAQFSSLALTKTAQVTRIQPAVDPRTRTVEIVAEIPNSDLALRPGLLAEVSFGAAQAAEAKAP